MPPPWTLLTLVTAPAVEPVTLAEAKRHCRIDTDDDDATVTALIAAARQMVEAETGRALIAQDWRIEFAGFPPTRAPIVLPKPPLSAVAAVTYVKPDGSTATWPAASYTVTTPSGPWASAGSLRPVPEETWPETAAERSDAVRITFTAGYGSAASAVPSALRAAILLLVGDLYEHREAQGPVELKANATLDRLLAPYRVQWFGPS